VFESWGPILCFSFMEFLGFVIFVRFWMFDYALLTGCWMFTDICFSFMYFLGFFFHTFLEV
jgi:hypothetical protein